MSSEKKTKNRKFIYLTPDDKQRLESRTEELLMTYSAYVTELVMWDNQLNLIERCRDGKIKAVERHG